MYLYSNDFVYDDALVINFICQIKLCPHFYWWPSFMHEVFHCFNYPDCLENVDCHNEEFIV